LAKIGTSRAFRASATEILVFGVFGVVAELF
jgi:hypothetical protein